MELSRGRLTPSPRRQPLVVLFSPQFEATSPFEGATHRKFSTHCLLKTLHRFRPPRGFPTLACVIVPRPATSYTVEEVPYSLSSSRATPSPSSHENQAVVAVITS